MRFYPAHIENGVPPRTELALYFAPDIPVYCEFPTEVYSEGVLAFHPGFARAVQCRARACKRACKRARDRGAQGHRRALSCVWTALRETERAVVEGRVSLAALDLCGDASERALDALLSRHLPPLYALR